MESLEEYIANKLSQGLVNELENIVINGLKLKGFEFDNVNELESFIKDRCRVEDYIHLEEKIYYVDNIPFLLHKYELNPVFNITNTDKETKVSASLGYYDYI